MSNAIVLIRKTILNDLAAINEIQNREIATSNSYLSNISKTIDETKSWYDEHQNSNRYTILSATINDRLVGWVALSPFRSIDGYDITAELSVYVHHDFQKKGIAKQMMQAIENFAIEKKLLRNIISVITANNKASIELHKKCGYNLVATLSNIAVKNGILQDVILMTKSLV